MSLHCHTVLVSQGSFGVVITAPYVRIKVGECGKVPEVFSCLAGDYRVPMNPTDGSLGVLRNSSRLVSAVSLL